MTANGATDAYSSRPFYITIANFNKVGVCHPGHQNVDDAADAPVKISYTIHEGFCISLAHTRITATVSRHSTLQADPERLEQTAKLEAVEEKYK